MKLSHIVSFVAISLVAFSLVACAEDTDGGDEGQGEAVQVQVEDAKLAPAYVPRVTMKDIQAGKGSCTTSRSCTINGRTWDCSGGGYCSLVM